MEVESVVIKSEGKVESSMMKLCLNEPVRIKEARAWRGETGAQAQRGARAHNTGVWNSIPAPIVEQARVNMREGGKSQDQGEGVDAELLKVQRRQRRKPPKRPGHSRPPVLPKFVVPATGAGSREETLRVGVAEDVPIKDVECGGVDVWCFSLSKGCARGLAPR